MYEVQYQSKHGASISRYFQTAEDVEVFAKRLRKEAKIRNSKTGEILGEIYKRSSRRDTGTLWNYAFSIIGSDE